MDFQAIREKVNLASVVEKVAGPGTRTGNTVLFRCPFPSHNDRSPSFAVYLNDQRYKCFGCGKSGDVMDFMQEVYGMSLSEARNALLGETELSAPPKKYIPRPQKPPTPPTRADVERFHSVRQPTVDYFHQGRSLSLAAIDDFMLGTQVNCNYPYEFLDGTKAWFHCRRYVIPWPAGNEWVNASRRLDTVDARERLKMEDPLLLQRVREDWASRKPCDVDDDLLMELIYGGKYLRWYGGTGSIFNINQIFYTDFISGGLTKTNGKYDRVPMEYVLIHEAPVSAVSTRDLGYPSTAVNFNKAVNYKYAYGSVHVPVIIADNDGGEGLNHANWLAEALENPLTKIVVVDNPFKDANEMIDHDVKNGTHLFNAMLSKVGISPLFAPKL